MWLRPAYYSLYRTQLRLRFALADAFERRLPPEQADAWPFPLPPARLRFRVGESTDPVKFVAIGQNIGAAIESALSESGRRLSKCTSVLEFGCGCGRVLVPLARRFPDIQFAGCDVDAEAIEWCRSYADPAGYHANGTLPPLPFDDAKFDLLYGISVFTHLSDQHQQAWLPELRRVLRPGGTLLLTVHGESVWKGLPEHRRKQVEREGHLFERSAKMSGMAPDWYQTSYHTQAHLADIVKQHFRVLDYTERGMGYQDVIVAEAS